MQFCPQLTNVEEVSTFKLIIIDHHLTWNSRINYLSSNVSRSINLLRQLSWFLLRSALKCITNHISYIPNIVYCDVVWRLPLGTINQAKETPELCWAYYPQGTQANLCHMGQEGVRMVYPCSKAQTTYGYPSVQAKKQLSS